MAELDVQIDARGAKKGGDIVVRQLDRIRKAGGRAAGGLKQADRAQKKAAKSSASLGQAMGALAGALALKKVFEYADAWIQVNNRIRLVTKSTAELAAVTDQVFRIAQETRVPLASTAELYARIARSADTLGISQQRVLDVTKSVSKAITISGVSAMSADAAIVQLGQGLASGALRGDELRSVLEQTPRLARAIADGLGVPIGKLRELGAAGKLSAKEVIAALESQAGALDAEFGTVAVTVGQSFTNLENSLIRVTGRFGEATGFFGDFASTIQSLSGEVDELGEPFLEASFAVSQFINAFAGGLATLDERFALFSNSVRGTLASFFGDDEGVEFFVEQRAAIEEQLALANEVVADGLDARLELFRDAQEERAAISEFDLTGEPAGGDTTIDPAIEKAAAKLQKELEKLGATLTGQVQTPLEEFQFNLAEVERALAAGTITQETYNRQVVMLSEAYSEGLPSVVTWNEQLERGAEITEGLLTPNELFIEQQKELNELLGVGAINQETYNRALLAAQDELAAAITKDDEFAKFLEQISIQAARNIQSAFADFLFDPFENGLDGLLSSFVDTLRKMAAEALAAEVFQILGNGLSSAGGGGGGGGGGFDFGSFIAGFFAEGGDFAAGRPIVVGEEGPEIITPRKAGTVIPNGGGQAPAPEVTVPVSIVNVTDPTAVVSAIESGAGQQAIMNVINQNPDAIRRALN